MELPQLKWESNVVQLTHVPKCLSRQKFGQEAFLDRASGKGSFSYLEWGALTPHWDVDEVKKVQQSDPGDTCEEVSPTQQQRESFRPRVTRHD